MTDTPIEQMGIEWTGRPPLTPFRTLDECMGDIAFNVKDFGAKGDSTNGLNGTDDLAAILAAYDAALAAPGSAGGIAGGHVYFPAGCFCHVSAPIVLQSGGAVAFVAQKGGSQTAGIGGSFPDYILNDELNPDHGISLGAVGNLLIQNRYINYLTSCSYASAGSASCTDATVSGTTLTLNSGITGAFGPGQVLLRDTVASPGTKLAANTQIIQRLTGTGGAGSTYQLNKVSGLSNIPVNGLDGGIVTFTVMNSTVSGYSVSVGDQFHVFGMVPKLYNGRYTALVGSSGTTFVGGGNCLLNGGTTPVNPGAVTMLGAVGGGGIRMDNTSNNFIEKVNVQGFNAMHVGGAFGYGSIGQGAYNGFGCMIRDSAWSSGFENGTYATVGLYAGETSCYNCNVFTWDVACAVSSNGFSFQVGGLEVNRIAILLGIDDQGLGAAAGASSIISNHTEDCLISLYAWNANQLTSLSNQWTGLHAPMGPHTGISLSGSTSGPGNARITQIPAASFTADTTIHSPYLTNVSSFANLYVGMALSGTGIPAGSYINTMETAAGIITFLNGTIGASDPVGASAGGSGVTITATVAVGMMIDGGTNLNNYSSAQSISAVSGGTYTVTLNKNTTGLGTSSYSWHPTNYGMLFGTGNGNVVEANGCAVAPSIAVCGLATANMNLTFINTICDNSSQVGLGTGWEISTNITSPNAAGLKYINCDNPYMGFPFASLPSQAGQSMSAVEGMIFDLSDGAKSGGGAAAIGDTVQGGGSGHYLVRYFNGNWIRIG